MTQEIDEYLKHYNSESEKSKREQQYIDTLPLAIEYIKANTNKCNVQVLQRHFSIPYIVASRILDTMEDEGMIGAWTGSTYRKVFMK